MRKKATALHPKEYPVDTQSRFAYSMRAKIRRRQKLHILLAEDDDSDVMLTETALEETHVHHALHRVKDGDEALQYLRRRACGGEGAASVARPIFVHARLLAPKSGVVRSGTWTLAV